MIESLSQYQITEEDINELAQVRYEDHEQDYLYQQEHNNLMKAYHTVLDNIGYYSRDERQALAIEAIGTFSKE